MEPTKALVVLGAILVVAGLVCTFALATQAVWEPRSRLLLGETVELSPYVETRRSISHYFPDPEDVRGLKVRGYIKCIEGGPISFEVTDGEVYVNATNTLERSFEFSVSPEELEDGLVLTFRPKEARVCVRIEAAWEERAYMHVLRGLVVGGLLGGLGLLLLIAALIVYVVRELDSGRG